MTLYNTQKQISESKAYNNIENNFISLLSQTVYENT